MSENWKDNIAFARMDPRKKIILEKLAESSHGKAANQCAPLLMAAMSELKKQNLTFSPEESAVLISLLSADLSPDEKQKLEKIRQIFDRK